jgi:hypothetical protein
MKWNLASVLSEPTATYTKAILKASKSSSAWYHLHIPSFAKPDKNKNFDKKVMKHKIG